MKYHVRCLTRSHMWYNAAIEKMTMKIAAAAMDGW